MATTGIVPVVEQVCNDQVQNGGMFTAHDITLEVRNRGHRVGHNEVRDAVHDYYTRGGLGIAYTRTSITVPAGGTPFLYHRTVDDASTYGNIRGQGMIPNPSVHNIAVPPPSALPDGDDGDDDDEPAVPSGMLVGLPGGMSSINTPYTGSVAGVAVAPRPAKVGGTNKSKSANKNRLVGRDVDGRDTLSIPAPVVRAAGMKCGDKVYVSGTSHNTVEITTHPTSSALCRKYTVDNHGHIRICQGTLKRAGIGGTSYDVTGDSSKITVKLH